MEDTMNDQEMTFDWKLLGQILRRRAVVWIILGPLLAATLLVILLFRMPPMYTSTASLSMQQATGGASGGALAALSGLGGSGTKSYLGIIRSRRFAAKAAQQAGIQQIYGFGTPEESTDLIQKSVTLDDRNDGLMYLSVTLPGPSRLSPGAAMREKQVREATKQVTDDYVQSLSHYLETSNSDRGAALLRQARGQLNGARLAYNASVRRLTGFATADIPADAAATASSNSASSGDIQTSKAASGIANGSGIGGGLQQLYISRGQLAAEIQAASAARSATSQLAAGRTDDLSALPAEDPLLAEARSQVRRASTNLQDLRIDLSDDNPEVVAARARLAEAQARLRRQSHSLQQGHTSESVRMTAMKAKYAAIMRQIGAAERDFKTGRRFSAVLEEQRNAVMLHLEVYKTAATQYAMLSMQTVAGGNLMDVIDEGRVPDSGKPGAASLAAISLCAVFFLLNLCVAFDYIIQVREKFRRQGAVARQVQDEAIRP
jgi:uncharacterized protein involved in exopolysaccharide biosynthesis